MGIPKKVIEAQTERDVHMREINRLSLEITHLSQRVLSSEEIDAVLGAISFLLAETHAGGVDDSALHSAQEKLLIVRNS